MLLEGSRSAHLLHPPACLVKPQVSHPSITVTASLTSWGCGVKYGIVCKGHPAGFAGKLCVGLTRTFIQH